MPRPTTATAAWWCGLAAALALAALAAWPSGRGWAGQGAAVPAHEPRDPPQPAAEAPPVSCHPGAAGTELRVAGTAVMRFGPGGPAPGWRCATVADRLRAALGAGEVPARVRPAVLRGHAVVVAGPRLLATVLPAEAARNRVSPALLAWIWANQLRAALGAEPLALDAAPFRGLPGVRRVVASWYGYPFTGRRTASGAAFDPRRLTAAHRHLPFGTLVRVVYPATGRQVLVVINDRGPYVRGRELDLSQAAAHRLGMVRAGVAAVYMEVVRLPARQLAAAGP